MKKVLALTLSCALALGLAACGAKAPSASKAASTPAAASVAAPAAKSYTLRYAENQPEDYPTTKAAYKFAEIVKEKSNGRINIEVYAGAQLGDEKSVIEQIQLGTIDFTRVSISPLCEFNKSLNVLQMPYLYKDAAQMWRVLDGDIGATFLKNMEANNMYGLSWFDGGSRNFYNSVRPVTKLEDMKGLKIRVQESSLMMGMVKALGAEPTPMAYGEVYSALQNKTIDGAENNWPSYESTSHYEVAKYFVMDEHTRVPEMQLISKATMEKLSAEDQQIIRDAAKESAKVERELWSQREKDSEKKVREGGSEITKLADGELAKFQAAMEPLYTEFTADYKDIVEAIRKA